MSTAPIQLEHIDSLLALAALGDERVLLQTAARSVARLLGDRASCVLIAGGAKVATSTAAPSLVDWPIDLGNYPEISTCLARRATVTIEDVRTDPLMKGVRSRLPREVRSIAVVPLLTANGCLGVLTAQSAMPRRFAPGDLATALLLAKIAATLTEQARARNQLAGLEAARPTIANRDAPRGPRRILIVDDDESVAADLVRILGQDQAYAVSVVPDGAGALRSAKEQPPDLILLDVMMPVLDGYATAERLARDPDTRDVPLLFLSGSRDLSARIRELELGTADFLSKPFTVRELRARVERSMQHLALRERLRDAAYTDELTGLGNLRLFHNRFAIESARSSRHGTPMALVIVDVDKLKKLNDAHGHAAGSAALKAVGAVLRAGARALDVPIRYGGDEFVILLPHSTLADGHAVAQRILTRLRAERPGGRAVTVSIGVAAAIAGHERSLEGLLEKADAALYRAKHLGGDQVCLDEETAPTRSDPAPNLGSSGSA